MKIKCPVALCGWEGKAHQFHKHIEEYNDSKGEIVIIFIPPIFSEINLKM